MVEYTWFRDPVPENLKMPNLLKKYLNYSDRAGNEMIDDAIHFAKECL